MAETQIGIKFVTDVTQLDKAVRSANAMENKIQRLAKAEASGKITKDQYVAAVQKLASELQKITGNNIGARNEVMKYSREVYKAANAHEVLENQINQTTNATNRFGGSTDFASRKLNGVGVVTQQAGYQIGDFVVQIQSGTNAFVALGQQLTQLIGTFGIFAKSIRAITIISTLGVIVPILTAIGAAMMRTSGNAKTFKDTLDDLTTSVSDYKSAMEDASASTTELNVRFGNVSDAMRPFLQDLVELERITAINRLQKSFENLEVSQESFMDTVRSGLLGSAEAVRQIRERLDLTSQEYVDFYEKLRVLQEAESFEERTTAARELSEFIKSTAGSVDQMTPSMREFYQQLVEVVLASGELNGAIEESANTIRESVQSAMSAYMQYQQSRIAGEFLAGRAAEQAAQSSLSAYTQYQQSRIAGEKTLHELVQYYADQAIEALEESRAEAERVQSVIDAISNADIPLISKINALANALGIAANEASRLLGNLPMISSDAPGAGFGPSDPGLVNQTGTNNPLAYTGYTVTPLSPTTGSRTGGGGGGTPDWMSQILSPEMQAAIEAAVEQTKEYEKEVSLLDSALEQGLITQQEYNSYIAQAQEAYNQSAEAANQYEDIILRMANTTSDAIGQAMMDIVTGTKSASDAFSDMAQIILKKAFELLVINPIINSIFGGSGLNVTGFNPLPSLGGGDFANGGVFSGGAQVQAFATGGVVGSPTFFPMANGGVGLMGEAGPEAIMPLKRGKGGRLGVEVSGEQGNVTINQTFAFQANGDDSVKRIIASEAPRIAALTQKQMLDARRRGGVVRDTFA